MNGLRWGGLKGGRWVGDDGGGGGGGGWMEEWNDEHSKAKHLIEQRKQEGSAKRRTFLAELFAFHQQR